MRRHTKGNMRRGTQMYFSSVHHTHICTDARVRHRHACTCQRDALPLTLKPPCSNDGAMSRHSNMDASGFGRRVVLPLFKTKVLDARMFVGVSPFNPCMPSSFVLHQEGGPVGCKLAHTSTWYSPLDAQVYGPTARLKQPLPSLPSSISHTL